MKADKVTPDTPEERAQFWEKKCKEAERELMLQYAENKKLSQRIANYLGENEKKKEPCYAVVWHSVEPKCYFSGYSLQDAIDLSVKIRKKHNVFAISILKEIEV
jgi:hypothetical protein